MQHCPNCGAGELKIIAAILERPVIEKILTHLGLDAQPPPRGRARQAGHDFAPSAAPAATNTTPQGCNATPQPGRRRATCQRGAIGIRVNPEDGASSEPWNARGPAEAALRDVMIAKSKLVKSKHLRPPQASAPDRRRPVAPRPAEGV